MALHIATPTELTIIRSEPQWSEWYLAGWEMPPTIFSARVNQVFADDDARDQVAQVTYDAGVGAFADVLPGMTLWIGSAAGLYDKGIARIRKAADATTLFIGEESEVDFDDDLFLTVVDEFAIWPKHVRIVAEVPYMDYETAYSDQHEDFDPVPIMGCDAVLDVANYPATVGFPEADDSWVFDSTISAYLWTASAGVLTGATTSDPTLTIASYPANGLIRVKLALTAANGKSFSGYRYVRVYDKDHRPHEVFQLTRT